MKFLYHGKDGGPDSVVSGWWLLEIKSFFSVALLRFGNGTRDAFHNHAFNSLSWVLKGKLWEEFLDGKGRPHTPSWRPITTKREDFHRVHSEGVTWVFTLRGPWKKQWKEYLPQEQKYHTLESGRKIVGEHGKKI